MQYIFLGPPGAGKGTQASLLTALWQIPHISTGEILRAAIAAETPLGQRASAYVTAGELVPDELILMLMRERLGQPEAKMGWILDGFPRNISQARALEQLLSVLWHPNPTVIYFDVNEDALVERLLQRGRQDDNEATIRRRLEIYREDTTPLIDYYQRRQCLVKIDGGLSPEKVAQSLQSAMLQNQSSPLH